jgi:4-hydroxybenzoate polyprenyltransferase
MSITALTDFLKAMRPSQWVKNVFVFAPLVFARLLFDTHSIIVALIAFGAFCLASSSIYLFNDILDFERDRVHPVKKFRSIASGRVSKNAARMGVWLCATVGLAAGLFVNLQTFAVLIGYLLLNVTYTLKLKHIAYFDVISISLGFILRILAGAYAIDVQLSYWIVLEVALLSMFLGFGKRHHEMLVLADETMAARPVLASYKIGILKYLLIALSVMIPLCFLCYSLFSDSLSGERHVGATALIILVAVWRFYKLAGRKESGESPTEAMLKDWIFVSTAILWTLIIIILLYLL